MVLFTTYLAALRKVKYCSACIFPKSGRCVKLLYVMRKRGNDAVAPSASLLHAYKEMKNSGSSEAFAFARKHYLEEIMKSAEAKLWIDRIAEESKHSDIILVCYEKDPNLCHRTILAQQIVFRHPEVAFLGDITDFENRPQERAKA